MEQAGTFVGDGVGRHQPVLVAVPPHLELPLVNSLRRPEEVRFVDMVELGRNPSRIIPAVIEFIREAEGRRCRLLAEPWWLGRSEEEIDEVARSDSLLDVALSAHPISVLRLFAAEGSLSADDPAGDPDQIFSEEVWPLEEPPDERLAEDFRFGADQLAALRGHVHHHAVRRLAETQRVDDLVLAVNEVASNSIRFAGEGVLAMWTQGGALVCEVVDEGIIDDPLVGLLPPGPELDAKGLWLVNQLCDLVQIRSGPGGTRVRVHVDCS